MKITNGLNLIVEETKNVFNPELFRLYDFYKFSNEKESYIFQLINIEDDQLTFLVNGQSNEKYLKSYTTTMQVNKDSEILNNCNIELISFNEVMEIIYKNR